uniref:DNA-directed RNA polymerase III subunit RPC9 n=1 Tax=Daphnia galeata TaxID=27404 RepID=A0A8J2RZ24_9CRUS|nr:unnamed protein product [Daphnia galeata]
MEIIDANTSTLTNYEVLKLLTSLKGKGDQARNQSGSATITYETIKYLEGTPASVQTEGCFKTFLEKVKKFGLTKKEKLMLMNLRPQTAVEISLVLKIVQAPEEERLTEEQTDELIQLIQNTLPEKML